MAKQTKDKRAIRNCNSKDGQYNGKPDKGQKGNQKLYFKGWTIQWQNRQGTKGQSEDVIQRTDKTMANRQTKEQSEAVIQRTNKNNGKTDKGQKGNQKL